MLVNGECANDTAQTKTLPGSTALTFYCNRDRFKPVPQMGTLQPH